jgi:putative transcriptional regulator
VKKLSKKDTFFEDVKKGLEDFIAHKEGKLTLRSEVIELPEPPKTYTAPDIKKIRAHGQYSQGVFAKVLNVSVKTVQKWEAGEQAPSHAASRLLEIVDRGIYRPEIHKRS